MFLLSRRAASALSLGALFVLASCSGGGGGSSLPAAQPVSAPASHSIQPHAVSAYLTNACNTTPVANIATTAPNPLSLQAGGTATFTVCAQYQTTFKAAVSSQMNPAPFSVTVGRTSTDPDTGIKSATVTVTAGASAGSGTITLTDTLTGERPGQSTTVPVTVTPPPPPTITRIIPGSMPQGATETVTIQGSNLTGTTQISISYPYAADVASSNIKVIDANDVTATFSVASNAYPGQRLVSVTTPGGVSNQVGFIVAGPNVVLVSPTPTAEPPLFNPNPTMSVVGDVNEYSYDFGTVTANNQVSQTFVFQNNGSLATQPISVTLVGFSPDGIGMPTGPDTCSGATLSPLSECSFTVTFYAYSAPGTQPAATYVASNYFQLRLTGTVGP